MIKIPMILLFIFNALCYVGVPDKCTKAGTIALTFDDGPTAYTDRILDILEENDIKATFHFTTQNINRRNISSIARRAEEEGHSIGLRVNPQRDWENMDNDDIKEDIGTQVATVERETGCKIKYGRAPVEDGVVNETVYDAFKKKKVIQSGYSYCFYDEAADPDDATELIENTINSSNPKYDSFIFLLHDEREKEFPTLETIIETGKKKGYKFVTLDDCLAGYEPGKPINSSKSKSSMKSCTAKLTSIPLGLLPLLLL
ncbi:Chitin/polysaccharide deacetylase [Spraguea lophii 42_110]|uniref:Chitin/polysaccharide deacetylase n=1 Tax=Spraguea lophii (strain 42_110) TaxID=1358809 RepID=S7W6T8_SPRLO|nr:Chitin/polysaccharide deacetylase [Spraguea lophii 42_110]